MRISEIFHSIQGEGVLAGIPMIFVRLQGCNLRCSYCDTPQSQDPNGGLDYSPSQIANQVREMIQYNRYWVCITGGEPLYQVKELRQLVQLLRRDGFRITIETNGTFSPPTWRNWVDSWVVDVKCPSSGYTGSLSKAWNFRAKDQVKFVVGSDEDVEFARHLITHNYIIPEVLISPVADEQGLFCADSAIRLCKEIPNLRLSIQLHKVLGVP